MADKAPTDLDILIDDIKGPFENSYRALWLTAAGLLGSIVLMWIFNIIGWQWLKFLNFGIAAIGFWSLWFFGLRPTNLVGSGLVGGLYALLAGKNKTQGIAAGPIWLYRILSIMVYGYTLAAITLLTWSFKEAPMVFWLAFFCVLALLLWVQVHKIKHGILPAAIVGVYLAGCIVFGLWTTFGGAYNGKSFDPCTGSALYLVDPETGNIHKKLKPSKCSRPAYSPETGQRLVGVSKEQAISRSPASAVPFAMQSVSKLGDSKSPNWLSAKPGKCSKARMIIDPGALITMPPNCPVYVDQVRWQNGVTWIAADPAVRRKIGDRDQELVSHARLYDQTHREEDRHILVLTPNPRGFERYGLESFELIFYPAGTAPLMAGSAAVTASKPAAGLAWLAK